MTEPRPHLSAELSDVEFRRWYWRKDELDAFARTLGLRTGGGKERVASRIEAALGGRAVTEPAPAPRASGRQLTGVVAANTVIPKGQRCSQVVRAWMVEQLGTGFHFDAAMRDFFAASDGTRTMRDALDHWRATRDAPRTEIGSQFEFNRFTRAWHDAHPGSSRDDALAAWHAYRALPVTARGRA